MPIATLGALRNTRELLLHPNCTQTALIDFGKFLVSCPRQGSRRHLVEGQTALDGSVPLSFTRVQPFECALQLFKLLTSLAELAFRGQALIVGEVFGSFRDEGVEVGCRRR